VIRIGQHTVVPVLDAVVRRDPFQLFRTSTEASWEPHRDFLAADGRLELFLGGYVVQTGGRLVLIDTGVGPDGWNSPTGAKMPGGFLPYNLRVAGFEPEAFTDVICTHLHSDHIGWVSRDGEAVFANATYRCHRADWAYFLEESRDDVALKLLPPIASRFEMWDAETTLFPGFNVVPAPGHTPGSTIVVLSGDAGDRAMLLGDVVHCPVQLLDDEWGAVADVDPALAAATRVRLNREVEGSNTLVGAAHFPGLQFGRVISGEPRRRWALAR